MVHGKSILLYRHREHNIVLDLWQYKFCQLRHGRTVRDGTRSLYLQISIPIQVREPTWPRLALLYLGLWVFLFQLFSSLPGFGIHTRRSGFALIFPLMFSTSSNLCLGEITLTPSTPAVFLPWPAWGAGLLSWLLGSMADRGTRPYSRTARSRA